MLIEEARWLARAMERRRAADVYPLCNVGSSTEHFRTVVQPWIAEYLFPIADRRVHHVDLKAAQGVDIVGDITDESVRDQLRSIGFQSVMCSNVLEHVTDPRAVARAVTGLLPDRGLIFASCPSAYPYHADPIDSGWRPSPTELAALFAGTELLEAAEVTGETYLKYAWNHPLSAARGQAWLLMPFRGIAKTRTALSHWRWLNRNFKAACVVLRKTG